MLRTRIAKRWIVLGLVAVAGGVLAGGVVAAQFAGVDEQERLAAAAAEEPSIRVADIEPARGLPARGVFVQSTSTGHLCLWDAPVAAPRARQGGCNRADDPLGGRRMFISLAYEGGPGAEQVTDARLIGLVAQEVASVQLLMTNGAVRTIPMNRALAVSGAAGSFRAFGYRFATSDLRRGLGPTAVLALDASGRELDRQTTGFGG
jgi:hypothetical protein